MSYAVPLGGNNNSSDIDSSNYSPISGRTSSRDIVQCGSNFKLKLLFTIATQHCLAFGLSTALLTKAVNRYIDMFQVQ